MKAALLEAFESPLNVTTVADPAVPEDGVMVRVRACGVCRSDWHGWKGTNPLIERPHVPGHEFAGDVVAVGPRCQQIKVGDRVTAPVIMGCGQCHTCRGGDLTICDRQHVIGFTGWGAFAELVAVPFADANVVVLPPTVSYEVAAALGCRTTTAFAAVVDRAQIRAGETLAVHGCGGVGLSAVLIGAAVGATVIAVDVVDDKLALAKDAGATHVINASTEKNVAEKIIELSGGGANVSIEALGITETFHNSLRCLARLGRHVQIGQPLDEHANPSIPLLETIYYKQLSLMGSRGLSAHRFTALFELISSGRIDMMRLIKNRISLEQASDVFYQMNTHEDIGMTLINRGLSSAA
ncbi:alcohol dehydrogenase [Chromatiales bacterium (ex Bugula neritina AB1)]|nr:alcohol dehydrogenase [Chromatiales bacterium (ex Bugula neritina AB1)]